MRRRQNKPSSRALQAEMQEQIGAEGADHHAFTAGLDLSFLAWLATYASAPKQKLPPETFPDQQGQIVVVYLHVSTLSPLRSAGMCSP